MDPVSFAPPASGQNQVDIPFATFTNGSKVFIGWSYEQNGDVCIIDGGTYLLNDSQTLYAQWADASDVRTITFDGNGGVGNPPPIYAKPGQTVVLPRMPFFQRDNCSLDRYYNVTLSEVSKHSFTMPDQDIVLRIDWSTDDFSFGGASPQFAGTTQWVRGVEVPESPTNGMGRNDDSGWYDTSQYNYNLCWAASGSNLMHWWLDQNWEYVSRWNGGANKLGEVTYEEVPAAGSSPYYYNKSSLLEELRKHFPDQGNSPLQALAWFVNGATESSGGGAYFKEVFDGKVLTWGQVGSAMTKQAFNEAVSDAFANGKGIGWAMADHAMTIWGAHWGDDGFIDRIYIANSADATAPLYTEPARITEMRVLYEGDATRVVGSQGAEFGTNVERLTTFALGQDVWEAYYREHPDEFSAEAPTTPGTPDAQAGGTRSVGTRADLVSALQDANVGTITLTADITLDANESLAINRSVTLDLGGHAITGADGPVLVAGTQGGTDAFKVVIKGNGTITGGNGGATMPGGLLVQGAGTQVVLESGAITGNRGTNGGGVWVRDNALFTMNGGSLSNNQADATMKYGKGGGVYVTGATFVMNDGSISNNTSTNAGGGVACGIGGVFTMNGGSITNNSVSLEGGSELHYAGGGGVAAYTMGATVKLAGGEVSNNSVSGNCAQGGGVLCVDGAVTLADNIQIADNTDDGAPSNVLVDTTGDAYLHTENLTTTGIGVSLKDGATGQFLASGDAAAGDADRYFTSDEDAYAALGGGAIDQAGDTPLLRLSVDASDCAFSYGQSVDVAIAATSNGVASQEGTVELRLDSGKTVSARWSDKGFAVVTLNPSAGDLGLTIGGNDATLWWNDGKGHEVEQPITLWMGPKVISKSHITWSNTQDRTEGDGLEVVAAFGSGVCLPADEGKVQLVVEGGRAQTAGSHTARVVALAGERAGFYALETNAAASWFNADYTIAVSADAYALSASPENVTVARGEALVFDVTVQKGGQSVADGTVRLVDADGNELGSASVAQGTAQVTVASYDTLSEGPHRLEFFYTPQGENDAVAQVSATVIVREGSLPALTWNGAITASGTYGDKLIDLTLDTGDVLPTYAGEEVSGTWRWRGSDSNKVPGVSDGIAYELVFTPSAGTYAELVVPVVPTIEKASQGYVSLIGAKKGSTWVEFTPRANAYSGAMPLYGIWDTASSSIAWQGSPLFTGLAPNTQYMFYAKYPETENYKEGPRQDESVTTLAATVDEQVVEAVPTASGTYGQALQDMKLTGGKVTKGGTEVPGTWAWADSSTKPNAGNTTGYAATFTPTNTVDGTAMTVQVYPNVAKADQSAPAAPSKAGATASSITVAKVDASAQSGAHALYGYTAVGAGADAIVWQTSNRFSGLSASTSYDFYVKYPGNENWNESNASAKTTISTEQIVAPRPSVAQATITVPDLVIIDQGATAEPEPTVVLNGTPLSKNIDYTVSYADNAAPGTATVTVAGMGAYTGTATKTFQVKMRVAAPVAVANLVYSGKEQVGVAGGTGYAVTGGSAINAGQHTATATLNAGYVWNDDSADAKQIDWSIAKAQLNVKSASVEDKVYDGTTDAAVSEVVFEGLVAGQTLVRDKDYAVSAAFADASVGLNKKADVTVRLVADGPVACNYALTQATCEATASITGQSNLSVSVMPTEAMYGDSVEFVVELASADSTATGNRRVELSVGGKRLATMIVEDGQTQARFVYDTKDKALAVGNNTVEASFEGDGGHSAADATCTASLQKKPLDSAVTGPGTKIYDGTVAAPQGTQVEVTGKVQDSDNVSAVAASLAYDAADVARASKIVAQGVTLQGAEAGWYSVPASAEMPASITRATAPLAPAGNLALLNGVAYDAKLDLSGLLPSLNGGMEWGDGSWRLEDVQVDARYYDAQSAPAFLDGALLTLSVQKVASESEGALGTVTAVYSSENFADVTVTVDVKSANRPTPFPADVAAGAITYGQALSASSLAGTFADPVTKEPVEGVLAWDDPSVLFDAGSKQASWTFAPSDTMSYQPAHGVASVTVQPAPVTLTLIGDATKVYDGTMAVPEGHTLAVEVGMDGLLPADRDAVKAEAGSFAFASATAGERTVVASDVVLVGDRASNYTALGKARAGVSVEGRVTGGISAREISLTAASIVTRAYDGSTVAPVASASFDNLVAGERLEAGVDFEGAGVYADANVGSRKPVSDVSVRLLGTAAAANYTLAEDAAPVSFVGTIVKAVPVAVEDVTGSGDVRLGDPLSSVVPTGTFAHPVTGADVPGTLKWVEPAAVLAEGAHEMLWSFTPDDATNYEAVAGSAMVRVVAEQPKQDANVPATPKDDDAAGGGNETGVLAAPPVKSDAPAAALAKLGDPLALATAVIALTAGAATAGVAIVRRKLRR